jgi:hypothetical protein
MLNFDQHFEKDKRTDMVFYQQQFVQEEAKNVVGMVWKRERERERAYDEKN